MPECPNCGVLLADSAKHCPLCRAALHPSAGHSGRGDSTYPEKALDPEDFDDLSPLEKRKIFFEIYSVCSLMACLVVLAIEFLISKRIDWSLYPVTSIIYLYTLVCIPLILVKRPWIVFAIIAPATLVFVFMIDLLTQGLSWFLAVGMPIVLIIEAAVMVCLVLSVNSKRKGVNIIALVLIGISVICVGIEIVINLRYARRIFVSWSAVVATACLPIAVFLFYLHYRITKRASLKKLFRL